MIIKNTSHFLLIIILIMIISSCVSLDQKKKQTGLNHQLTEKCLLRLHGSSTIGAKLMPALVSEYLQSEGFDSVKQRDGSTPMEKRVYGFHNDTAYFTEIFTYGSGTGFTDLGKGACDIAMSSKPIDDLQLEKLKAIGRMRDPMCQHIIGLDGITIIVHQQNPLKNIDLKTIRSIFNGNIQNWEHLTNNYKGPINIYARDENSGTSEVFKTLVMGKDSITPKKTICTDNIDMSRRVSLDPYGIGYASITLANNIRMLSIKASASTTEIPANEFNVLTDEYPLSRSLFLYTAPIESTSSVEQDFIAYVISNKGQKIVEENGFIARIPKLSKPVGTEIPSRTYEKAIQNAMRVSITFHFASNKYESDPYMNQNLDRLSEFINNEKLKSSQLVLIGFSDSIGNDSINKYVSYNRAKVIGSMLQSRIPTLKTTVLGLGKSLPIAPNDSPLDRQKNRRVEVWIHVNS